MVSDSRQPYRTAEAAWWEHRRAGHQGTTGRAKAYPVLLDMPKKTSYARIAITLPKPDLAAADRLARLHDRSRSWIVAEAIRRFAAAGESPTIASRPSAAATDSGPPLTADLAPTGLGSSRLAQLKRDLALTPEARVRAAEETLRASPAEAPRTHRVIAFDRYEDFLEWQRTRNRAG